ncbi:MAG TPA: phage tail sheath subtilisin-like domain-containing protein [Thermoanaerobaculia bacterium]|nr:phage tail sheath subtilisin-like domain-containing protein [Thermoanaerobaculia bacterium]
MPSALTFPGVYVEEIPSGVRTITGVATSIAAFVGRTRKGAAQTPRTITSWADFERVFGGLSRDYPLSYAVRDFYENGGTTAIILRLFKAKDNATPGVAKFPIGNLQLKALSEGKWGDKIGVKIDKVGITEAVADAVDPSLAAADFFNLTVINGGPSGPKEVYLGVTLRPNGGSRRLDRVLAQNSNLIAVDGAVPDEAAPPDTPANEDPTNAANYPPTANPATAKNFTGGDEGVDLDSASFDLQNAVPKTGLEALEHVDLFNLLCIPPPKLGDDQETDKAIYQKALSYCARRRAMLIVDPPKTWTDISKITPNTAISGDLGLQGPDARNAAVYFPRVKVNDPLIGQTASFVPCGMVAGVMARTDVTRGVWKAPAGVDAALNGAQGLTVTLTDLENGLLNPVGINCLRTFPIIGTVIWGARTARGADLLGDEYKYVPVRRLALFLEESLFRGTQWVVFEPNDEPLWAQIRLNVGSFMHSLFRQGAFQGASPRDAYFVMCDKTTTTQQDINTGIVNVIVGFAPLKPAEFVVLKIQQMAGQIQT